MPLKKIALATFLAVMMAAYLVGGGEKYLSIDLYQDLYETSPLSTASVFFLVFLVGTSCSLPVAGVLSVASGVVFGVEVGFVISSLATTLGGTIALYATRFLFHDLVKRRFSTQLEIVDRGIEKEGAFYLFSLRMVAVIPFWLLNLLMALTAMKPRTFMLATYLGMIPILLILVYTGDQLGEIDTFSMAAVFSPGLILALAMLAGFPFFAKAFVGLTRRMRKKKIQDQA